MRRSLFGLLTVVAVASLLLVAGCEVFQVGLDRSGTLRVVSINGGKALRSDMADYFVYFDKVDSEYVTFFQFMPDSVQVELQYVEIGPGLPTWTPYVAHINKAVIKYITTNLEEKENLNYSPATFPLTQTVQSDPDGKQTTTFYMKAVTPTFKQTWFTEYIDEEDPYLFNVLDLIDATVTFTGFDTVANREVQAAGKFQIEVGNFYDDPSRFGQ